MANDPKAAADTAKSLSELMARKLELAAKIHDLEAEIARINIQMQKLGAQPMDLICW